MADSTDDVTAALTLSLHHNGFADQAVAIERGPGPLATTVISASVEGAYPGTGRRTALLDERGNGYGHDLALGLAELVRARGGLTEVPAIPELVAAINYTQFDGLLITDDQTAPAASVADGTLLVRMVRRTLLRGDREWVTVRIGASGAAQIEVASAEPAPLPPPTPIDNATGLVRAIDAGNGAAISAAVVALGAPRTAREFAALARATTVPQGTAAADAMGAIGTSADAVQALREALTALDESARARVIALALDFNGAAFAASLNTAS